MIVTLVGALVVVVGLSFLRDPIGHPLGPEPVYPVGLDASFLVWGEGAEPEEWRKVAYTTCATQSVKSLAGGLGSASPVPGGTPSSIWPWDGATAEAVARAYARFFQNPHDVDVERAIYSGCLQGFRDKR